MPQTAKTSPCTDCRTGTDDLISVILLGWKSNGVKMSVHNSKRWHFELGEIDDADGGLVKSIKVIHDGKELVNHKGIPLGHIVELHTPSSWRLCKQAKTYLPYAVEV